MQQIITDAQPAPLWRRLAAILYDVLLVVACWIVLGFIFIALNKGEAITKGSPLFYALQLAMCGACAGFYVYFWVSQGQTLGMRAWRLIIANRMGKTPTVMQALWRWLLAVLTCLPLGFGFLWQVFDEDKRTLYDSLSNTRLYLVGKNPYRHD